jgi:ArsR family metal-binding transcriptional regulator
LNISSSSKNLQKLKPKPFDVFTYTNDVLFLKCGSQKSMAHLIPFFKSVSKLDALQRIKD